MKNLILILTFTLLTGVAVMLSFDLDTGFTIKAANPISDPDPVPDPKPGKTMRAFASAKELKDYFAALAEKQRKRSEELNKSANTEPPFS
jgi:hypothetical protein